MSRTPFGQAFRQLKNAGDDVGRVLDNKLPSLTRKIDDHLDDLIKKVKRTDTMDDLPKKKPNGNGADGNGSSPANSRSGSDGPDTPRGNGRNDGRDERGRFVGDGNRPWVDREKVGLDNVADREGVTIIRDQVASRHPDTGDQIRYYDGLFENADGTYTGVEVKSGTASRNPAQRLFDGAVSVDRPAFVDIPNVGPRTITNVILERVP